jgi:subfamily B ATP-binding cassette protein HlyB/CyaB
MTYFQARRVGDSVARVRELETIRHFLTSSALTVVLDLVFAIVFLAVMYIYSPTLLLIVLVTLPAYAAVLIILSPILRRRLDEKFARGAENQAFLVEAVTGIETIKAHAVEPQMQQRWELQLAAYIRSSFRAAMLANWGRQGIELIQKLGSVALLFFGARLVIEGKLTVGELVAFNRTDAAVVLQDEDSATHMLAPTKRPQGSYNREVLQMIDHMAAFNAGGAGLEVRGRETVSPLNIVGLVVDARAA